MARRKKKNSYTKKRMNKLAYDLGQIERGKKNTNSQIYASYNNGLNKQSKKKKLLF